MDPVTVRAATTGDAGCLAGFIRDLAEYEELAAECVVEADVLVEHLFGSRPWAEAAIAEVGDDPAGFALFFPTYSTFLARPGLWLEDLYVAPPYRRAGVGRALLVHLAGLAADRGCGRLEWSVLDWNQTAIDFYERLGARLMDGWTTCRVEGETLAKLAGS